MLLLPINVPAEIHRLGESDETVARGPLVIMAHGLLAIDAERRKHFTIRSPLGDLSAAEAEEVLRRWNGAGARDDAAISRNRTAISGR